MRPSVRRAVVDLIIGYLIGVVVLVGVNYLLTTSIGADTSGFAGVGVVIALTYAGSQRARREGADFPAEDKWPIAVWGTAALLLVNGALAVLAALAGDEELAAIVFSPLVLIPLIFMVVFYLPVLRFMLPWFTRIQVRAAQKKKAKSTGNDAAD